MTEIPTSFIGNNSKLVPIDKQKSRLPLTFLECQQGDPNEKRFNNINKAPAILSTVRKVAQVHMSKVSGRKQKPIDRYKNDNFYDSNFDSVRPNPSRVVPDFDKFSSRNENIAAIGDLNGHIDNTRVVKGMEYLSHYKKLHEISHFSKQLDRD
jgi:hypothetical protein